MKIYNEEEFEPISPSLQTKEFLLTIAITLLVLGFSLLLCECNIDGLLGKILFVFEKTGIILVNIHKQFCTNERLVSNIKIIITSKTIVKCRKCKGVKYWKPVVFWLLKAGIIYWNHYGIEF